MTFDTNLCTKSGISLTFLSPLSLFLSLALLSLPFHYQVILKLLSNDLFKKRKKNCAASLLRLCSIFNPSTIKFFFSLSFGYTKLCFKYDISRLKIKFDWDTCVPVGVKGLKSLRISFSLSPSWCLFIDKKCRYQYLNLGFVYDTYLLYCSLNYIWLKFSLNLWPINVVIL